MSSTVAKAFDLSHRCRLLKLKKPQKQEPMLNVLPYVCFGQIFNSTMTSLGVYCLKSDFDKHSVVISATSSTDDVSAVSLDFVLLGTCDVNTSFSLPLKVAYHCKIYVRPIIDGCEF